LYQEEKLRLGHNPAAALYSGYYKNRREKMEEMVEMERLEDIEARDDSTAG
jgi:hypothetical protein